MIKHAQRSLEYTCSCIPVRVYSIQLTFRQMLNVSSLHYTLDDQAMYLHGLFLPKWGNGLYML